MKPKIGVSWLVDKEKAISDRRAIAYMESVKKGGGEPVYLPLVKNEDEAISVLSQIDGLVVTGGADVNPKLYGEENIYSEESDVPRDISDMAMLKCAISHNLPVLCICRGVQMLNVVCGGTLYQDLKIQNYSDINHSDPEGKNYLAHKIIVEKDSLLYKAIGADICNFKGWHHQAIKNVGEGLRVVARSEDGNVEAVELVDAKYIYGVQFHPERYTVEDAEDATNLFKALVDQCRKDKQHE